MIKTRTGIFELAVDSSEFYSYKRFIYKLEKVPVLRAPHTQDLMNCAVCCKERLSIKSANMSTSLRKKGSV
jgi:hypothetical protein